MNIKDYLNQKKRVKLIKKQVLILIRELRLYNSLGEYQKACNIKFVPYGFELYLKINGICDYSRIENNSSFIKDTFGAVSVETENNKGLITFRVFTEELEQKDYIKYILPATTLLCGYNYKDFITADMLKAPHILISGLSGNGKSRMVNYMLNNLIDSDIVVLNGFEKDYKGFTLIYGHNEIESYLKALLEDKNSRATPLYIVLEEMQGLNSNNNISKLCKELLSYGRHYNIFVIGVIQVATKENCKFKDLFNSRLTFKQNDSSAYTVCLGVTVPKELRQREFYLYAEEGLIKGKTFTNRY